MDELADWLLKYFSVIQTPFFDKVYAQDRITQHLQELYDPAENGEEIIMPYAEFGEVMQPYRDTGLTFKGNIKFDNLKVIQRRFEINFSLNPNKIVGANGKSISNLLRRFKYSEKKSHDTQLIAKYASEQIIKQAVEDRVKKMVIKGVYVPPPPVGTPAPAASVYDGLLAIKNQLVAAGDVVSFPVGALPTAVGLRWKYLQNFIYSMENDHQDMPITLLVCKDFFLGLCDDLISNNAFDRQFGLSSEEWANAKKNGILQLPTFSDIVLVKENSMLPADGILGFVRGNACIIRNENRDITDSLRIKELEDTKQLAIIASGHECVGFCNPKFVYANS